MPKRLLPPLAALALVAGLATACSDPTPDAEPLAEDLATALEALDLSTVPLDATEAQSQVTAITEDLGERRPTVEVSDVEQGETTADVTLAYAWPVADDVTWSYETQARLDLVEDTWQVHWDPALLVADMGPDERLEIERVTPVRGNVLAGDGTVLVGPRAVQRIGIDKTLVPAARQATSARDLARLVGVDAPDFVRSVAAAGPRAFVEAIVLRTADAPSSGRIEAILGARSLDDELPLAPTASFAAPILGTVGEATAELIEQSDGRLEVGDRTGLSGLQLRYDESLRGRDGWVITRVSEVEDDPANPAPEIEPSTAFEQPPEPGEPLRTTFSRQAQSAAERILSGSRPASALVALRASDGAILAAAVNDRAGGQPIANYGRYAPGSTFKLVAALGLLRAGATPSTTLSCPRAVVVDGKRFENYDGYPASANGRIPLRSAIAQSCNTAMINARGRIDQAGLADAAASLGMGVDQDLGFPAYFGEVPTPAETRTEHAASMIGQGRITAAPLTMATVVASITSGATTVPYLLPEVAQPEVESTLTKAEASDLRAMMRATVAQGSGRVLQGLGPGIGAKTGTAEYGSPVRTHAWMVASDPRHDLAVAVFVQNGDSGSGVAGPLLRKFLQAVR
ncbi:cell division protein FtsI/penicillin-binding protein 2 [Mumia flava]|uniref:Beta-lactamase n=1 Tax=Mumia flava TaxID=1348852 RepID=A0A2M9BEL5_9ACTN|nr:penicillin-binding transpeptidase domain-containing protein [Mumia flava]PJJ56387.1 cell division protein FtsI/penicillin-binding protein 2 [Mumia flava]